MHFSRPGLHFTSSSEKVTGLFYIFNVLQESYLSTGLIMTFLCGEITTG